MDKSKSSLSNEITKLLNEQIRKELESAYLYFQIANYFESVGLAGFANWFKVQAKEEILHGEKIYNYLVQNNAPVNFYEILPTTNDFHYLAEPLEKALKHEKFVTDSINQIYKQAVTEQDFRTQNFLSWFIQEQMEEEVNAKNLLDSVNLFAGDADNWCEVCSCALYELDHTYGKRS